MQRYKKQIGLPQVGEDGQEKLKNSKVLVIGVGGLGCAVLPYLAAAGIGKLGLVDGDRVDESNLQRQVLFREKSVGKFKVTEARKQLFALNSEVKIENYQEFLNGENALQLIKNYDLVVDCTDSLAVRYLINDACVLSGKAFVYASVYKFEFQVSVFNFKNGPTYRCLFPDEKAEVQNCEEAGVLGTTVGLAGMFQATEVLKILLEAGEVLSGKLLLYNTLFNRQDVFEFSKNQDLKIDNDFYNRQHNETFSEEISAEEINENALILDVRETHEQPKMAFPRMLEIPLKNLENELCRLNPEKEIQVLCQSGKRSLAAVKILEAYDFKNVKSISGGVVALEKLKELVEAKSRHPELDSGSNVLVLQTTDSRFLRKCPTFNNYETLKDEKVFIEGAIQPGFVAEAIAKHQSKKNIGAHNIFLGQIRADEVDGKEVKAIAYSAYEEMAGEKMHEIREDAFKKFNLTCMHIYHSLGEIKAGELCFFVFVSSKHRKQVYEATEYLVNRVKSEVPIFGKEVFASKGSQWKVNT